MDALHACLTFMHGIHGVPTCMFASAVVAHKQAKLGLLGSVRTLTEKKGPFQFPLCEVIFVHTYSHACMYACMYIYVLWRGRLRVLYTHAACMVVQLTMLDRGKPEPTHRNIRKHGMPQIGDVIALLGGT